MENLNAKAKEASKTLAKQEVKTPTEPAKPESEPKDDSQPKQEDAGLTTPPKQDSQEQKQQDFFDITLSSPQSQPSPQINSAPKRQLITLDRFQLNENENNFSQISAGLMEIMNDMLNVLPDSMVNEILSLLRFESFIMFAMVSLAAPLVIFCKLSVCHFGWESRTTTKINGSKLSASFCP